MSKEALVVNRKTLFEEKEFQGFLPLEKRDFISIILKKHFYHLRGDELENNHSLQQIIPYVWIINPKTKNVFLYKRALTKNKGSEHKEKRYLNKYSGGVGGHIDKDTEEGEKDPIMKAMMRELKEEVIINNYPIPKLLGYINDDSDSLGKVHFGIVAIVETTNEVKANSSEGLASAKFYSINEIENILSNKEDEVENWTRISWPFVKSYLEKL